VPAKLRRHEITETPEVAAALNSVRAATGADRVNIPELVVLGARVKVDSVRAADNDATAALEDLAEMVKSGTLPVDRAAAEEARHSPPCLSTGLGRRLHIRTRNLATVE